MMLQLIHRMKRANQLPNPTPQAVSIWLKNINREHLHHAGWVEVNKRFHGLTRAMRPFLREQFPDLKDQEAAFDGLTLALLAMTHFEDIEQLRALFAEQETTVPISQLANQKKHP